MATKSLSKLKAEMLFNSDLTRLVDVMKGVSASQFFITEKKRSKLEEQEKALNDLFSVYDFRYVDHPFIAPAEGNKLIVLVTTDSGFLGGLNMKVAQAGMRYEQPGTHYLVLGERGANFLKELGKPYTALPGINMDETRYALMEKTAAFIMRETLTGKYATVILVYPHSVSFTAQRVEILNIIPCPRFYADKPENLPGPQEQAKNVILESGAAGIIEYMTALWLRRRLLDIFEDSKLSEFGARTMHLESSYATLTKIDKQLKLQFFKARREKIDQSLRESFTSQLLCKE